MGFFDLFRLGSFPRFGHVNLDRMAELHGVNHRLSIDEQKALVERAHNQLGLDASYGGWMEHRGHLWQGTYLEKKDAWIHLGVDVNVPEGTPIYCPWNARVLAIKQDKDQDGGWGTRVILKRVSAIAIRPQVVILGHLGSVHTCVEEGQLVFQQMILGEVGGPENNGGWYPHLHVQMVDTKAMDDLSEKEELQWLLDQDGYGDVHHLADLARTFPDPVSAM